MSLSQFASADISHSEEYLIISKRVAPYIWFATLLLSAVLEKRVEKWYNDF
jgi:hypothetical protein